MGTLLAIQHQFVYNSKHVWFLDNFFTGEDLRRITNANAGQVKCPKRPSAQTPFPWVALVTLDRKLDLSSVVAASVNLYPVHADTPGFLLYLVPFACQSSRVRQEAGVPADCPGPSI